MEANALADSLVEAGIGQRFVQEHGFPNQYLPPGGSYAMCGDDFITDWRVAGKCLELMKAEWDAMPQSQKIHCKWSLWHLNRLNPRAIVEDFCEAQNKRWINHDENCPVNRECTGECTCEAQDKERERLRAAIEAAKEVVKGQDQPNVFSSGQVFVDIGSLRAMEAAIRRCEALQGDSDE